MTERTYGYRYNRSRTVKDDAARIRADVKALAKAGMLPADWTDSVRLARFSGGQSIDITARAPRAIFGLTLAERDAILYGSAPRRQLWSDEAQAVHDSLKDLLNGYNHDGSDLTTDYHDVKFYGDVIVTTANGVASFPADVSR